MFTSVSYLLLLFDLLKELRYEGHLFNTLENASSKAMARRYQDLTAQGLDWYYRLGTTTGNDDGDEVSFTGFRLNIGSLDAQEKQALSKCFYALRRIRNGNATAAA